MWVLCQIRRPLASRGEPQREKLSNSAEWAPTRWLKIRKSLALPVSVTPWKIRWWGGR